MDYTEKCMFNQYVQIPKMTKISIIVLSTLYFLLYTRVINLKGYLHRFSILILDNNIKCCLNRTGLLY